MTYHDLIGKHLLVGLTYTDQQNQVIRHVQFHGTITHADERGITLRRRDNGEDFSLPPALESIQKAPPGEYKLKSSGEVVVDPDFLCCWTVKKPTQESDSHS